MRYKNKKTGEVHDFWKVGDKPYPDYVSNIEPSDEETGGLYWWFVSLDRYSKHQRHFLSECHLVRNDNQDIIFNYYCDWEPIDKG